MKLHRIWFVGLALVVAIAAIAWGQPQQWAKLSRSSAIVQAQTPAPPASPAPPAPVPEIEPPPSSALPLAPNPYQDPEGRFQVGIIQELSPAKGILEDFKQSVVAGIPLFESSDGELAYTVTVRPRINNRSLEPWILIQVATDTFARGEGMLIKEFEPVNNELGGAIAPWTGTLTMGRKQQPMQGILLSRQIPDRVLILAIAATEKAADRVDAVYATLEPTLKPSEEEGV
ncbi:MAG: hypothetical protein AB4290_08820 [Spirulina sp.]